MACQTVDLTLCIAPPPPLFSHQQSAPAYKQNCLDSRLSRYHCNVNKTRAIAISKTVLKVIFGAVRNASSNTSAPRSLLYSCGGRTQSG